MSYYKVIIASISLAIFYSCAPIKPPIIVQTSARTDPFNPINLNDKTFSFVFDAEKNDKDPLIEKQLLFTLQQELIKKGWLKVENAKAHVLFHIDYDISGKDKTGSKAVKHTVNKPSPGFSSGGGGYKAQQKETVVTQQQYTYSVYNRVIKIEAFQNNNMVWSADIVSEGRTNDIQYIGKYLIGNAILKFPSEGTWKERVSQY